MLKKIVSGAFVAAIVATAAGCGSAGEDVGQQSEAILTSHQLAVFDDQLATWYYDTNNDGVWTNGVDFASAVGAFGGAGDIALSGTGDVGACKSGGGGIGVYRPSTRTFFLDINKDGVWNSATDRQISNFLPAASGFTDQPIIWSTRNGGTTEFPNCMGVVGIYRTPTTPGPGVFYVDLNNDGVFNAGDGQWTWGVTGHIAAPLTVFHSSALTVFEPSTGTWYIDANQNKTWDGCAIDSCKVFGVPNTKPIANPNLENRGVSDGSTRLFDVDGNGTWNSPPDASYTFGISRTQAIIL